MQFLKYISLIIGAFITFGCEKTIEFDGEVKKPKLVINSIFGNQDTFKVNISRSLSLVDQGELKNVESATISVFNSQGDLVSTPEHDEGGNYVDSSFFPNVGEAYTIEVEAEDYDDVTASSTLPSGVNIISLDTFSRPAVMNNSEFVMDLKFEDAPGSNYYMLTLSADFSLRFGNDSNYTPGNLFISALDPNLSISDEQNSFSGQRIIFEDRTFDGRSYTMRISTSDFVFNDADNIRNIELNLHHLSEDAFNYFVTLNRYKQNQGDPFSTPVQVYSNVQNGFGIFGAASKSSILVRE